MAILKSWDEYAYKVFVSYSHDDKHPSGCTWGEWLEEHIEAYRIPKDLVGRWTPFGLVPQRIRPVFRDRSSFGAGSSLNDALRSTLDNSATLVVVCSPASAQSKYVDDEINYFKASGRADRVFALIVAGEPREGSPNDCFPPSLRHVVGTSAGDRGTILPSLDEPIAADARAEGDGHDKAFLKLVAGLLGVDLTALEEKTNAILARDARRARLTRDVFAVLAAVAVGASVAAYYKAREAGRMTSQTLAYTAQVALDQGYDDRALKIAMAANQSDWLNPVSSDAVIELGRAIQLSRLQARLPNGGPVNDVAMTSDARRVVVASSDGSIRVWSKGRDGNWSTRELNTVEDPGEATHVAMAPRGGWFVAGYQRGQVVLWRPEAGGKWTPIPLPGHTGAITSIGFASSGNHFVTASEDETARVWLPDKGTWRSAVLAGHTGAVNHAIFSPASDDVVLTTSLDGKARLWARDKSGNWTTSAVLEGSTRPVSDAAFFPDGAKIATVSQDGTIRIWSRSAGLPGSTATWTAMAPISGGNGPISSIDVSPDGRHLVETSVNRTAIIWVFIEKGEEIGINQKTGEAIHATDDHWEKLATLPHEATLYAARFCPGLRTGKIRQPFTCVATIGADGVAAIWRDVGSERWQVTMLRGHASDVMSLTMPKGSRFFATAGWDGQAMVWDFKPDGLFATKPIAASLSLDESLAPASCSEGSGMPQIEPPHVLACVNIGGSHETEVKYRGAQGTERTAALREAPSSIASAAISEARDQIVTHGDGGEIALWSEQSDHTWTYLTVAQDVRPYIDVGFSEDGSSIIARSYREPVVAWDIRWQRSPGAWRAAHTTILEDLCRQGARNNTLAVSQDDLDAAPVLAKTYEAASDPCTPKTILSNPPTVFPIARERTEVPTDSELKLRRQVIAEMGSYIGVSDFRRSLNLVLKYEGGMSDDPHDPGGRTKDGITHTDYDAYRKHNGLPLRDVFMMEDSERDEIYRTQYWDPIRGDELPSGLNYLMFDSAVNSGIMRSVRWVQRALGSSVEENGKLNDTTLKAIKSADVVSLIHKYCEARRNFIKNLSIFRVLGKNWIRRVDDAEQAAIAMARETKARRIARQNAAAQSNRP